MNKHVLISGFKIVVGAWVGDTADSTLRPIAGQEFNVRPADLQDWVENVWPVELEKLKAGLELAEAQREASERLQAIAASAPDVITGTSKAVGAIKAVKAPRARKATKARGATKNANPRNRRTRA